jgi:hypothetical protein
MLPIGLLILWSSGGQPDRVPYFSAEDREDIEAFARERGLRVGLEGDAPAPVKTYDAA